MPIVFHEHTKEFHLYNQTVSYLFKVLENGQLGHLYYGKKIKDRPDFGRLVEYARRDMAPNEYEGRSDFSMEHLKQEYPAYGSGDMRCPAYEVEQRDGSRVSRFVYKSHRIYPGKKPLCGLPAAYVEEEKEAVTLEVRLEESRLKGELYLSYTIYEERPVITKSARFVCRNEEGFTLLSAMSGSLDLPDKEYEMVQLSGAWSRERYVYSTPLRYGLQSVYSLRGCSSHQFNPFLALKRKETTEHEGEVLGFNLVYSGDFLAQAEVDAFDVTRVTMGIHPAEFSWHLEKGEEFQTPELVMAYSHQGLNGMSQAFHSLYRERLARGEWRDKVRPILINNWEATYFDFDEERILGLAREAKKLGIELFVLDDGWFGKRDSDNASLGDWYPNLIKLPGGIKGLSEKIEAMGMKFGLWFEPEMTNKDSDLFRSHPDWLLSDIRGNYCHSRNQYVLDFSKKEVVDCIYRQMEGILADSAVSYIKWDMNRSFSEVFSNGREYREQGKVRHRYMLGVYELYERLIKRFPHILFESCASGGARFDAGMLYYAPQAWASDNTDAVERLRIQYGSSFAYPLSSIGSHVSASPNHQVFRKTSMKMRGAVAFFGTFGYELDIAGLSGEELLEIQRQVAFMKEHRKLIQFGDFYRLRSPFEQNSSAWMVVSKDQTEALAAYFRVLQPAQWKFERIILKGLKEEEEYLVRECFGEEEKESLCYGDELMNVGMSVSDFASGILNAPKEGQGDYLARLFYLKRQGKE